MASRPVKSGNELPRVAVTEKKTTLHSSSRPHFRDDNVEIARISSERRALRNNSPYLKARNAGQATPVFQAGGGHDEGRRVRRDHPEARLAKRPRSHQSWLSRRGPQHRVEDGRTFGDVAHGAPVGTIFRRHQV